MPSRSQALELARRIHSLVGGSELLRKAAARELARYEAVDATELMYHLIWLARQGQEPAKCVLPAFVAALSFEAASIPFAPSLRRLAELMDMDLVSSLFPEVEPAQQMDADAAARRDAQQFSETLGHLKSKARLTRDTDELSRLATSSNAAVLQNLLLNPRMTEELVVRIAARRPTRPEPLVEIWRSDRWSPRPAVRRALAFNPFLPPEVGSKLVPLLSLRDLVELAQDASVHAAIREQAKLVLERAKLP